jgi:hypothetical protein
LSASRPSPSPPRPCPSPNENGASPRAPLPQSSHVRPLFGSPTPPPRLTAAFRSRTAKEFHTAHVARSTPALTHRALLPIHWY